MPLPQLLTETYRPALEEAIPALFDEFTAQLPEISKDGQWALAALKDYSLRPSKRIRGALAAAMYDHARGLKLSDEAIRLGVTVELLQNYLLIVDDVMDHSELRRGKPAIHKLYEAHYADASEHETHMAGVLIGLFAQHCANIALLNGPYDPSHLQSALKLLHSHMTITDIGQIDDMRQDISRLPVSTDALQRKYVQKSSYYSFVNPLQMALVLAGKEPALAERDALAYGLPTGVAFQLRDDYLGIFGESDETGKPNLDDIREGKYTFMVHYALEKASPSDKQKLMAILGTPSADEPDLASVREILVATEADKRAMADAAAYGREAKQAARASDSWDESFAELLDSMIDFIVERQA